MPGQKIEVLEMAAGHIERRPGGDGGHQLGVAQDAIASHQPMAPKKNRPWLYTSKVLIITVAPCGFSKFIWGIFLSSIPITFLSSEDPNGKDLRH